MIFLPKHKSRLLRAGILLGVVFALYLPTLHAPLVFDDSHLITINFAIQNPENGLKLWSSAKFYASTPDHWSYRPATTFMNWLGWQIGKGKVWAFHVQKMILHAAVCFLLSLIWSRLWRIPGFYPESSPLGRDERKWGIGRAAFVLALLFAIHPANTQVVNYISATSTLLCGFFYLFAFLLYLLWREGRSYYWLIGSGVAFVFSVLAKEEGITLPAVIALTEGVFWWRCPLLPPPPAPAMGTSQAPSPRQSALRRLFILGAFFSTLLLLCLLLLRAKFESGLSFSMGSIQPWTYFMTQWRAYLRYLRMIFVPTGMTVDNLEFGFSTEFMDPQVVLALLGNLALLGMAWRWRRRFPGLGFGLLWFYITISPASSLVPLAEPVNDHRMYLAYFGIMGALFPFLMVGLERLSYFSPSGAIWTGGALVVACLIGTEARNAVWRSDQSLWEDTLLKNPNSGRARNNLALSFLAQGEWLKARQLLEECERILPQYSSCQVNLGVVASNIGEDSEAEKRFLQGVQFDGGGIMARTFLANFYLNRGLYSKALLHFEEIDRATNGMNLQAIIGQAQCLQKLGKTTEVENLKRSALDKFGVTIL